MLSGAHKARRARVLIRNPGRFATIREREKGTKALLPFTLGHAARMRRRPFFKAKAVVLAALSILPASV